MSKKDAAAGAIILSYLNEQNRPYSAQDVFMNLQKQHGFGKTAVVKVVEQLAQEGKIREKVYGKQKIYFADQGQFTDVSDTDLKDMDTRISELSKDVQEVSQSCRQLESELKELNSSLTTEEMTSQIQELEAECASCQERLEKIKSATNHISPQERAEVYKSRNLYVKEWRKRKRMTMDMMDAILEGYPKSKKHFLEEVGVETDEDYNVTVPTI
ncbi:homologous-pairing protein 2 homolog [Engraulis encrasicolus]|uniref:homologous-pairing protein 2 homolog n=1 Tax=Engraulis encrasicolus TaxID=184585 RepID=UPI002FD3BC61